MREYVTVSATYYCNKQKIKIQNVVYTTDITKANVYFNDFFTKRTSEQQEKTVAEEFNSTQIVSFHNKNDLEARHLLQTWADGYYFFDFELVSPYPSLDFALKGNLRITKNGNNSGYLPSLDFPLLFFFCMMVFVYIGFGMTWIILLACSWRNVHRIHLWIGGIILLGILENTIFLCVYENINNTGQSLWGAIYFAEIFSCLKRSLARMLVLMVSLGYGIVKPSLGQTFYKVLIVGAVFFILALCQVCIQANLDETLECKFKFIPTIPLLVIDGISIHWIFNYLRRTMWILQNRKEVVKLTLCRRFRHSLIFSVLVTAILIMRLLVNHRICECISDWKELWMDEASWHILFSLLLFINLVLWHPTSNNLRYAFTPVLDSTDDACVTQRASLNYDQTSPQFMDHGTPTRTRGYRRINKPAGYINQDLSAWQTWTDPQKSRSLSKHTIKQ
ncbi:transmembrane protein 87A-like [Physella acuta]|uniref:transmembrane protein 87A-like n=1 Tax=Physella acuta TaxID=109671 RepID=UPI0027DB2E24|nr:transmembrane protein 87A-like [Physella acuta]